METEPTVTSSTGTCAIDGHMCGVIGGAPSPKNVCRCDIPHTIHALKNPSTHNPSTANARNCFCSSKRLGVPRPASCRAQQHCSCYLEAENTDDNGDGAYPKAVTTALVTKEEKSIVSEIYGR